MSFTLHSLFYQLYQLTSALQLRLSKFNSLSLSTPFHFRFHDLIKWPFCSLLCYRYINSKQNGYHSSLIILFKMKTLFPIKFANTILSQLPRTCFAVLVCMGSKWCKNALKKFFSLWRGVLLTDSWPRNAIFTSNWAIQGENFIFFN